MTFAASADSDQHALLRSFIKVFVSRIRRLWPISYPNCNKLGLITFCTESRVDKRLRWSDNSRGKFSRDLTYTWALLSDFQPLGLVYLSHMCR